MNLNNIAFIPARKGSKSIKFKNLRKINGETLVELSIKIAKKTKLFDKIIVSSDSNEIIKIASKYNVFVIKRPKKLSTDASKTEDALFHALKILNNKKDANIIILQPTSPLRKLKTIKKFYNYCLKNKFTNVLTVSAIDHNISKLNSNKKFIPLDKINLRRRQDRNKYIFENGDLYFCKLKKFLIEKKIYSNKNWNFYETDLYESIDINNYNDLKVSKILSKKYD